MGWLLQSFIPEGEDQCDVSMHACVELPEHIAAVKA